MPLIQSRENQSKGLGCFFSPSRLCFDEPSHRRRRANTSSSSSSSSSLSLLTLLPGFLVSKVVLVLFLRATRLCGRTFALQLLFFPFLSRVALVIILRGYDSIYIYYAQKKRFWRIIIASTLDLGRESGERDFFFCLLAKKHCLKKEPPAKISLSLSLIFIFIFISSSSLFFSKTLS